MISQDIGLVLLNLYNNAFYADTGEKETATKEYEPTSFSYYEKNRGKAVDFRKGQWQWHSSKSEG